ncbi:MAG TPA: hypothetical protein VFW38_12265 [Solirubrobacteraceae bacterium]|nr:hypothetical protein [Solirubrobacteraceae bacterium]
MEYRTWTSVADLPLKIEDSWLPLTRYLERRHPQLGPVATWEGDALVLILAEDQPDPATAAERAATLISEALHACGLADRFPTVFQVEAVSAAVAA